MVGDEIGCGDGSVCELIGCCQYVSIVGGGKQLVRLDMVYFKHY
jgi:hypothetical protein